MHCYLTNHEQTGILGMNRYFALGLVTVLLALAVPAASDVIAIDGSESDWLATDALGNIDSKHDDLNNDVFAPGPPITYLPEYDIDFTWFVWDEANGIANFYGRTVAPITNAYGADAVEIIINADDDKTTGSSNYHDAIGADYYLTWDLDGTAGTAYEFGGANTPLWYEWVGDQATGGFQIVFPPNNSDLKIAWDDDDATGTAYSFIEVAIEPTLFGSPDEFTWGMYLDNGTTASDDASPNSYNQRGYTPEPGTMALLSLGIAGLLGWRRRRED